MNLHAIPYPYPPYARKVVRNSGVLWVLLRSFSLFTGPAFTSVLTGVIVAILTAGLVWFEGRRFGEHLFHANLGASPAWAIGISLVVAGGLEIVAQVLILPLVSGHVMAVFG